MDKIKTAKEALGCMDLTSLGVDDDEDSTATLCGKAHGRAGSVAAVCVWPRLAGAARRLLPEGFRVAAVANFPTGSQSLESVRVEIAEALAGGANEIDVVFPYSEFLAGAKSSKDCADFVAACKRACGAAALKVILETGAYASMADVRAASEAALDGGADFLKTSTGKIEKGASTGAARAMMEAIAGRPGCVAGFKVSGGVRTVEDALAYMELAREVLGMDPEPGRFRIGASGLLADIERVMGWGEGAASSGY
jgi:deoxyribose-phosphate aldolase